METKRAFETGDAYLAAFLAIALNVEPSYRFLNGRTICVFEATESLYQATHLYNSGAQLPAIDYATAIKRIRGEFITRRNMGAGK